MTVPCKFIHPQKASTTATITRIAGNIAIKLKYEIAAASLGASCFNIIRPVDASVFAICRKKWCLDAIDGVYSIPGFSRRKFRVVKYMLLVVGEKMMRAVAAF
jgi:hypothetical protein